MPRIASRPFPEKNPVHPVHPCKSIFLLLRPIPNARNHRVSFPVPGGPFLNPFSFTRTPGPFPLSGSRTPSFFVCLRGPSWITILSLLFQKTDGPPSRPNSTSWPSECARLLCNSSGIRLFNRGLRGCCGASITRPRARAVIPRGGGAAFVAGHDIQRPLRAKCWPGCAALQGSYWEMFPRFTRSHRGCAALP